MKPATRHAALLVGYLVLFVVGRATRLSDDGFALWWPAAGVAMLWGVTSRHRGDLALSALLLCTASTVGNLMTDLEAQQALSYGVANAMLAIGAWTAMRGLDRTDAFRDAGRRLRRPVDLTGLLVVVAAAALASVPPMLVGLLSSDLPVAPLTVLAWLIRQVVGGTSVLAFVIAVAELRRDEGWEGRAGAVEALALVVVTALVVVGVFGEGQQLPLAFTVTALTVWSGSRFAPAAATAHGLVTGLAVGALYYSGAGGPLAVVQDPLRAALVLQGLGLLLVVLALSLSLAAQENAALVRSLSAAQERERSRADLLDTITDSMVAGLVVLDPSRRVHLANDDARRMLNLRHDVLPVGAGLGLSTTDGREVQPHEDPVARALAGDRVMATDLVHVHPVTGERRVLAVGSAPVRHADGRVELVVLVLRDVTERHRRLEQVEAFTGTVAHDLQNPLTAAHGWSEILGEQLEDEAADVRSRLAGATTRITGSLQRCQSLVDDLLAFSRSSSSDLRREVVDMGALVADQVADVSMRYADRHVVFERGDLGLLRVDRVMLTQLLANLLGNAVKYVGPGTTPVVRVSLQRAGDGVRLDVADNGSGVPDSEKLRIFEAFHRAHPGTPGTGLGLAICAQVAERHGGFLSVHDADGQEGGSVFSLWLPDDCVVDVSGESEADVQRTAAVPGMGVLDLDADLLLSRAVAAEDAQHEVPPLAAPGETTPTVGATDLNEA